MYEISNNWSMFVEDNKLFLSRGADEIFYFDEAQNEQVSEIYDAFSNNSFDQFLDNAAYKDIIANLERAGVIYRKKHAIGMNKTKLHIKYLGTPAKSLKNEIDNVIAKRTHVELADNLDDSHLLLLARINVPLKNVLIDYSEISVPHLLIDLGFANTISIGPLVFKNETACLGCYVSRIINNWGDPPPPNEPQVIAKSELIASLIIERIEEFITLGNCPELVNGVWNFNVKRFKSGYDKVYRLPWCPLCNASKEATKIELPWINEVCFEKRT